MFKRPTTGKSKNTNGTEGQLSDAVSKNKNMQIANMSSATIQEIINTKLNVSSL
jgi:hypothetical protein